MVLFNPGDKVAVLIWNKSTKKFHHKTGEIIQADNINHYLVKFDDDRKLYLCHTSKLISTEAIEQVEIAEKE